MNRVTEVITRVKIGGVVQSTKTVTEVVVTAEEIRQNVIKMSGFHPNASVQITNKRTYVDIVFEDVTVALVVEEKPQ